MLPKIAVHNDSAFQINAGAFMSGTVSLNDLSKSVTTLKILSEVKKKHILSPPKEMDMEIAHKFSSFLSEKWGSNQSQPDTTEETRPLSNLTENLEETRNFEKSAHDGIYSEQKTDENCFNIANTNCKDSKEAPNYDQFILEHRFQSQETKRKRVIYKCTYENCGKQYHKRWNLIDHIKTHLGIMPYQCGICQAKFVQKGNLKKHLRQHAMPDLKQRKAYQCPHCHKSYTEKYNLSHHLTKHTIQAKNGPVESAEGSST